MALKGFVDLHTHGFGRYDTQTSDPGHILKVAELHGRAGTAAIVPTIYSGPIERMRRNMEAVRQAMEMQESSPDGHQAAILGVHLEGPFLNPLYGGALQKRSFLPCSPAALRKLINGYESIIRIITIAPELGGALRTIERCASLSVKVNMGHSDATYRQALDGWKAGATGITHLFNAMRPFHHREPGLAGFGLLHPEVFVEVIADGFHLHPETLRIVFSLKASDRILLISDSVKGARGDGKPIYAAKGILAGSGLTISGAVSFLGGIGFSLPPNQVAVNARLYLA